MRASRLPSRLRGRPHGVVATALEFGRDWLERFVAVQGIDRAMAIGAQAYTALIPLLIVYASVLPRQENASFADVLVHRFGLRGTAAAGLRRAFAPDGTVRSGVTLLGVVLLLVSALAFTRGLQRLYEGSFGLPSLGVRNTRWGLAWIAVVGAIVIVRPHVLGSLPGTLEVAGSLTFSLAISLATPYLLLGRRLSWRRLAPLTVLSTLGLTGVGVWSAIWMPHAISSSAQQFGVIGVGFALLTWLVAVAVILVVAATGGALIADRLTRRSGPHRAPAR